MQPLYVGFTMDCEQLSQHSFAGGPADWELSERAIVGFATSLLKRGHRATFFIIPQAATQHASLFLDLQKQGFELGLHIHALDQGWSDFLGGLAPDELWKALVHSGDIWSDALGQAPRAFRGGHFSANDHLFPLLVELGFTHGSVSLPQRRVVRRRAVWDGALPYPHWAHAGNRLLAGNLPFFDVPSGAHPEVRHGTGGELPLELRIEGSDRARHVETVNAHLNWQIALDAPIVASVSFTHNTKEYSNPDDEMTRSLHTMMDIVEKEAEQRQMPLIKATIEEMYLAAKTQQTMPGGDTGT